MKTLNRVIRSLIPFVVFSLPLFDDLAKAGSCWERIGWQVIILFGIVLSCLSFIWSEEKERKERDDRIAELEEQVKKLTGGEQS